jgi:DNA ligase-1
MRYKPMLAYPVSKKPVDYNEKVYMQPKLDGVRCLIQYEAKKYGTFRSSNSPADSYRGEVVAYSRTGKEWKNIEHILFNLKPFFQLNPDAVLDGELYNHDLRNDFEQIISCVRKTKPTTIGRLESSGLVQFHCYDVPSNPGRFDVRNEWIKSNVPGSTMGSHCIKHVETHEVHAEEYALDLHKIFLSKGYEGSILRLNTEYQCKRSHSLRKFKDFKDSEAVLTDWVEGKGKRIGTIGKFMAIDSEGNTFGMPVMDKFKYLQDNFEDMKTWVGQTATFTYFERTKANSYRHPLFKCIRNYE